MKNTRRERGFTLIELMIVVILLGILAAIMIPQYSTSTEDAKVNSLKANLSHVRNAAELYYNQHNETYPGDVTSGVAGHANDDLWFVDQLVLYTKTDGSAKVSRDVAGGFKYGPYVKEAALLPNPFNGLSTVLIDDATTDVTDRTADGTTGWKFYTKTGVFVANDNTTLTDGATVTSAL